MFIRLLSDKSQFVLCTDTNQGLKKLVKKQTLIYDVKMHISLVIHVYIVCT